MFGRGEIVILGCNFFCSENQLADLAKIISIRLCESSMGYLVMEKVWSSEDEHLARSGNIFYVFQHLVDSSNFGSYLWRSFITTFFKPFIVAIFVAVLIGGRIGVWLQIRETNFSLLRPKVTFFCHQSQLDGVQEVDNIRGIIFVGCEGFSSQTEYFPFLDNLDFALLEKSRILDLFQTRELWESGIFLSASWRIFVSGFCSSAPQFRLSGNFGVLSHSASGEGSFPPANIWFRDSVHMSALSLLPFFHRQQHPATNESVNTPNIFKQTKQAELIPRYTREEEMEEEVRRGGEAYCDQPGNLSFCWRDLDLCKSTYFSGEWTVKTGICLRVPTPPPPSLPRVGSTTRDGGRRGGGEGSVSWG